MDNTIGFPNTYPIYLVERCHLFEQLAQRFYFWREIGGCGSVRPTKPTHEESPGAPNGNFRENICSEDDLRPRIFGAFVVKFPACLPLLGFSNIYKMVYLPILTDFDSKKGHLEFSAAFSWLKFSRR